MKLSDIGEFGLIHRVSQQFLDLVSNNTFGIGDDCAVIPQSDTESLLVTTDLLIENVHFLRNKISPHALGHKALAVNLSDIAAMGGTPSAAFLSIGLPDEVELEWLDAFFAGIHDLSRQAFTPLLGGDTTKSKTDLIINFAVMGSVKPDQVKYRSTAKPGDIICVTGNLGDSGGGLNIILNNLEDAADSDNRFLVQAHHSPRPHLAEGQWLGKQPAVHAMLDVSDGIDSDIQQIMKASDVGAQIAVEQIPMSESLLRFSARHQWNAMESAVAGGEDYCLLCTVSPESYESVRSQFQQDFGRPLYSIGVITPAGALEYQQDGTRIRFGRRGWDHFKQG